MKRLVTIFVFLTSTTYSGISVSNDTVVTTTSAGNANASAAFVSWVVKDDEIYFCSALDYKRGIVSCIKARETNSE